MRAACKHALACRQGNRTAAYLVGIPLLAYDLTRRSMRSALNEEEEQKLSA
jgi:hypothetical protein